MPSRQVLYPPFGIGTNYKIFNNFNQLTARLATYVGEVPAGSGIHRFQTVMPVPPPVLLPPAHTDITINGPNYWQNGNYVGLATNAGGRRRKSKRSKRSYRKTKRRHH
jgi:hypothetical protein